MAAGKLQYAILGLLGREPMSGYDLQKAIEEEMGHFWSGSFGQIYPEMRRLAERGLVVVQDEQRSEGGRPRTVYALSSAGRNALRTWLREPPEPDQFRSELLLKLAFGDEVSPAVLARAVRLEAERARQQAAGLERRAAGERPAGEELDARLRQSLLAFGVRQAQAAEEWAGEVLAWLEPFEAQAKRDRGARAEASRNAREARQKDRRK